MAGRGLTRHHPTVGQGLTRHNPTVGGGQGILPLLEILLTSFLQGQHLGEGLITFQVLLRNGAIFGDIFQDGIALKIETENRIWGALGIISMCGVTIQVGSCEERRPLCSV